MNLRSSGPSSQTLGACLCALGPGDPCPCCGARLKVRLAAQPVRDFAGSGAAPGTETAVLACPQCGCEVASADCAENAGGCRPCSVAA